MRIGVMGVHYGHFGGMLQSATMAPDGELVGMVEADDGLYEQYGAAKRIPRYKSLREMLEEAKPELILEGGTHVEKTALVEACAAAGVHVLLDKPLCRTMDELRRIEASVVGNGIQLSMWYTSRSYPPFVALREMIQAGELGEIVSLISTHPHKLSDQMPSWYFNKELYSGTFVDLAGHGVDQIQWVTGAEFQGVHALGTLMKHTTGSKKFEMDHVQASFKLNTGALATVTADWLTAQQSQSFGDTRFIIMGTKGSAHLRAYASDHLLVVTDTKGVYEPAMPLDRGNLFVQNLIEALSRGEEPFVSTAEVLRAARASLMAQQSALRGGEFLAIES
jgi:predicted dehydrogenase